MTEKTVYADDAKFEYPENDPFKKGFDALVEKHKAEKAQVKADIWREEDMVNHPAHYTDGSIECIDAIESAMEPIAFCGFLKGQVLKYLWRYEKKWNQLEDIEKARFYLDKLHSYLEEHPNLPFKGRKEFTVSLADLTIEEAQARGIADLMEKDLVAQG